MAPIIMSDQLLKQIIITMLDIAYDYKKNVISYHKSSDKM